MKGFDKSKFEIEILSREYLNSKRVIREAENSIIRYNSRKLERSFRIVYHIEYVVESLDEDDKFIIRNELMEGRRGDWYLSYFSPTAYYRHREKAYENFLHCL